MKEQTGHPGDGLIPLPRTDLASLEEGDDSALFSALRRIITETHHEAPVSGFSAVIGAAEPGPATPPDDL
ncbi:hypothetical protein GCM10010468_72780 [Actinocorallia longicatena]|uniref:FXSXX-COOH protein n=1 Tax=Actinocorallia longicatena TaxID=111803 RepID=A0ABP6QLT8_9ACTN